MTAHTVFPAALAATLEHQHETRPNRGGRWAVRIFPCNPAAFAAQAPTTEDFVKTVAISDMFEIQSGQLAAEKAQNGDVKSFGQEMVDDHSENQRRR